MQRKNPFKHHRFPAEVILCAVRLYLRYPLSYADTRDLLAERGINIDRATIYRWVLKFGPEIAKRSFAHRNSKGLSWHVDETYIKVNGEWCYLWRAVDAQGQFIDFRLTRRRDAKAAKAFFRQAFETVREYRPIGICTDKSPTLRKVIAELNDDWDPLEHRYIHVDEKHKNNRIESDHAALKRLLRTGKSFRRLHSAKSTLKGIEAIRTIKHNHIRNIKPGVRGEIEFVNKLFDLAA